MNFGVSFFVNSILLGFGLAMDAFSVSLANGLNEPHMKKNKMSLIAGTFCFFQIIMPLIGWICVSTIATYFTKFQSFIPWIALILLGYIGGKMIYEGIKNKNKEIEKVSLSFIVLIIQGIATSIDALSVGFTISNYSLVEAIFACLIIGAITFIISFVGLAIGKTAGTKLSSWAFLLGGTILIFIGIEILATSLI